jgi:hypothetical protein
MKRLRHLLIALALPISSGCSKDENKSATPHPSVTPDASSGVQGVTVTGPITSGGPNDIVCGLFGQSTPFSADKLKQLYPTHTDYVDKVKASALATRQAGFILSQEEATMVAGAEAAAVPE